MGFDSDTQHRFAQWCFFKTSESKGARYIINSVPTVYRLHYFIYGVKEYEGHCILWYVEAGLRQDFQALCYIFTSRNLYLTAALFLAVYRD